MQVTATRMDDPSAMGGGTHLEDATSDLSLDGTTSWRTQKGWQSRQKDAAGVGGSRRSLALAAGSAQSP